MSRVPLESSPRAASKLQGRFRSYRGPHILNKTSTVELTMSDSARGSAASTRDNRGFFGALALLVRAWNPEVIGTRAVLEHPRAPVAWAARKATSTRSRTQPRTMMHRHHRRLLDHHHHRPLLEATSSGPWVPSRGQESLAMRAQKTMVVLKANSKAYPAAPAPRFARRWSRSGTAVSRSR